MHHTVDRNDYTRTQVPAMVRGMYAYHVKSRGWCDLGYNFLVDRFGRAFEGRYGGTQLPVLGAHTGSYNANSFGVSMIGNYEKAAPTAGDAGDDGQDDRVEDGRQLPFAPGNDHAGRQPSAHRLRPSRHQGDGVPGQQAVQRLGWLRQRINILMGGSVSTPIYRFARRLGFRWSASRSGVSIGPGPAGRRTSAPGTSSSPLPPAPIRRWACSGPCTGGWAPERRLGLPITEMYEVKGGMRQKFQRGWLIYNRTPARSTSSTEAS